MAEQTRKRGRPVSLDTEAAMGAVVELFRSKGFAAVSLDELSEATDLSRPSLYRAFGNKLDMYIGAMDAFGAQVAETALPALQDEGDLDAALSGFFDAMLAIYFRDPGIAPGCLVFGTAPSSADEIAIKSRLRFGIEQLDAVMRARILQSAPACSAAQIEAAVHLAANTLIAFSARAKAGVTQAGLSEMGGQCARSIAVLLAAPAATV